jgi:hypothetical protein
MNKISRSHLFTEGKLILKIFTFEAGTGSKIILPAKNEEIMIMNFGHL